MSVQTLMAIYPVVAVWIKMVDQNSFVHGATQVVWLKVIHGCLIDRLLWT